MTNYVFPISKVNITKLKSLLRFTIVGSANTGIDFLLFLFLLRVIGANYLIAQTTSYAFGVVNSFALNRVWTFDNNRRPGTSIAKQFVQFITINVLSLSLSLIGLKTLNGYLGVNIYLAKIMVLVISWCIGYIGYRYWVFEDNHGMKGCKNL